MPKSLFEVTLTTTKTFSVLCEDGDEVTKAYEQAADLDPRDIEWSEVYGGVERIALSRTDVEDDA